MLRAQLMDMTTGDTERPGSSTSHRRNQLHLSVSSSVPELPQGGASQYRGNVGNGVLGAAGEHITTTSLPQISKSSHRQIRDGPSKFL